MTEDLSTAIEVVFNRLAGESVLAAVGRDEGLIPAYSLLGELAGQCAEVPALLAPVRAVLEQIESLLDRAQPFDAPTLATLHSLVEWLPTALESEVAGRPVAAWVQAAPAAPAAEATPASAAAAAEPDDTLLELNLGENRELLQEFHSEAVEHLQAIESALLALEHRPDDPEAINSVFRSFHTIKGNAGFLGLVPMRRLAHEVETLLDLVRTDKLRASEDIITGILRSRDALLSLNQQVGNGLEHGRTPDQVIPVAALIATIKRLAAGSPPAAATLAPLVLPPVAAAPEEKAVPAAKSANQTIRVNTDKLDALMDVVGELVIVQSQLTETARLYGAVAPSLAGNVGLLTRLTKELQHNAMSLRMIAIQPTFQKMERLIRDLARDCGKKAVFTTAGGDTELDRTMVEEIADPLVHMVRNSLDHGLESPEERIALGKPETGTVSLSASHQGGKVLIEMRDDGRGLNREKILAKARQKGLIAADVQPSPEEILQLIFLPGFSTAEKVTSVSGRGVGMDVVRRNIERLRGEIAISSELGKGTLFTIKLPLTMAIIDGLVVRVGEQRYVLPATSVQRAVCLAPGNIVPVSGCGEAVDLRGGLVPLRRLDRLYGIAAGSGDPDSGIVVVLESSGRTCALFVDEMVGKQEVVIKNLGSYLQGCSGVAGATILGDGTIALILDPASILQAA
jgi:two-component system, chemotaxis family, sensor kinase CheA